MAAGGMLVIGVGNSYRSDDGAGLQALRMLRERPLPDGVRCLESDGDGAWLLDMWTQSQRTILIDAVSSGVPPGTLHLLDPCSTSITAAELAFCSSHAFGVWEAIQLAVALDRLPSTLLIYGIEGMNFKAGTAITPAVEHGVQEAIELIWRDIQAHMIK